MTSRRRLALAAPAWTDVEAAVDAALGAAGFRRLPTAQYWLPGASPEPDPS